MLSHVFHTRRDGLSIYGEYCLPRDDGDGRYPAVIISHGFGGCALGLEPYAELFCSLGYAAFWFDFCGGSCNGRSEGRQEDMRLSTECDDLRAVIAYAQAQPFVDETRLTLLGISMGGLVSALTAAQNDLPVESLVLISPALCVPDDARRGTLGGARYDPASVPPVLECPNHMRLSRAFQEEAAGMDVFGSIRAYRGPVLIHHGKTDCVVPFGYSLRAKEAYGDNCELHLVEQVDHSMSGGQLANALRVIRLFLAGKRERLHIDVKITGHRYEHNGVELQQVDWENGTFVHVIPFVGTCLSPAFQGYILPGGVDRQTHENGKRVSVCADYRMDGLDETGRRCTVHIVNRDVNGDWSPRIETDSPALAWLANRDLTSVNELHPGGLSVCIFA